MRLGRANPASMIGDVIPGTFTPLQDIRFTRHNLPHWQQAGTACFVTFRLADSVPANLLHEWIEERARWRRLYPPPWSAETDADYRRQFTARFDAWLDLGHGSCALREPAVRLKVADALRFFDGERHVLHAWVVMPNHVHVCFTPSAGWTLEKIVFAWKRRSAGEINALTGRKGPVWQRDYFDRLVRDAAHFAQVVRYIRRNGEKARLRPEEFTLWEGEAARGVE